MIGREWFREQILNFIGRKIINQAELSPLVDPQHMMVAGFAQDRSVSRLYFRAEPDGPGELLRQIGGLGSLKTGRFSVTGDYPRAGFLQHARHLRMLLSQFLSGHFEPGSFRGAKSACRDGSPKNEDF